MKTLILGNIKFNVEVSVQSTAGLIVVMKSAECLETGVVYNKDQANEYYRLYSV